jgi:hypothetical protein
MTQRNILIKRTIFSLSDRQMNNSFTRPQLFFFFCMTLLVRQAINFRNLDKVSTRLFSQCCLFTLTKHHAPTVGHRGCLDVPVPQTIGDGRSTAPSSSEWQIFLTTSNIKKLATGYVIMVLYNMTNCQFCIHLRVSFLSFFRLVECWTTLNFEATTNSKCQYLYTTSSCPRRKDFSTWTLWWIRF